MVVPTLYGRVDYNHETKVWSNIQLDSDFTFYLDNGLHRLAKEFSNTDASLEHSLSADHEFTARLPDDTEVKFKGRCLLCMCSNVRGEEKKRETLTSTTVRADGSDIKTAKKQLETFLNLETNQDKTPDEILAELRTAKWVIRLEGETASPVIETKQDRINKLVKTSGYKGKTDFDPPNTCSIAQIAEMLFNEVFLHEPRQEKKRPEPALESLHGAILIAGQTKSAKSLITRAMIHMLFEHEKTYGFLRKHKERNPHLLTCEDPVETWFAKPPRDGVPQLSDIIDYTARDRNNKDYDDLADVFVDALRQTPACMLVGETRKKQDLKELIDFAGTGHLVVTTLHAGSLQDVFTKVFEATAVETSSKRGLIGKRILAAVHLKQIAFTHEGTTWTTVVPTLWRRTPASTNALVASGIGSLTPHVNFLHDCLGRQYFAKALAQNKPSGPDVPDVPDEVYEGLVAVARNLDLQGE